MLYPAELRGRTTKEQCTITAARSGICVRERRGKSYPPPPHQWPGTTAPQSGQHPSGPMRSDSIAYQSRTIGLAPHAGQNVVPAPAARRRGRRQNRSTRIRHAAQSPPSEPPAADVARGTTPVCAHGSSAGQSWPAVRWRWLDRTRRLRRPGGRCRPPLPESETTIIMTPPHIYLHRSLARRQRLRGRGRPCTTPRTSRGRNRHLLLRR